LPVVVDYLLLEDKVSHSIPPEEQISSEHETPQVDTGGLVSQEQSYTQADFPEGDHSSYQSKKEVLQPVVEQSKEAALDTWTVFQLIWKDPVDGLQTALATLGDSRAFNTGIALCIVFILTFWIAVLKIIDFLMALLTLGNIFGTQLSRELGFSEHLRIILGAAIPVVGMIAVLWGIRQIFKGAGNYKQFTFVTGLTLAPVTFFLILLWLLGTNAGELMALVSIFCFSTVILFLNTALIGILRLSSRNALLLVPTLLVADFFITRVGFDILF
jgi:hypothetical protein